MLRLFTLISTTYQFSQQIRRVNPPENHGKPNPRAKHFQQSKTETSSAKRKSKREYLNDVKTTLFTRNLSSYFEKTFEIE
jgi:hypothetical protein